MIVYLLQNVKNDKCYVGQTVETLACRWRKHKSNARRGSLSRIAKAIRKYGEGSFIVQPIATASSISELNNLERVWITLLRTTNGDYGYNVTAGGDARHVTPEGIEKMRHSMIGKKHTAETKQKIADAVRRRWMNPAYKQQVSKNISETLTGRRLSASHRQAIGLGQAGKALSESHKRNISLALGGKPRSLAFREKMVASWQLRRAIIKEQNNVCSAT